MVMLMLATCQTALSKPHSNDGRLYECPEHSRPLPSSNYLHQASNLPCFMSTSVEMKDFVISWYWQSIHGLKSALIPRAQVIANFQAKPDLGERQLWLELEKNLLTRNRANGMMGRKQAIQGMNSAKCHKHSTTVQNAYTTHPFSRWQTSIIFNVSLSGAGWRDSGGACGC